MKTVLLVLGLLGEVDNQRVSLSDIEGRLRSLSSEAHHLAEEVRRPAPVALGATGGLLILALVYLLGRRRGRRRSTVLEIRRV